MPTPGPVRRLLEAFDADLELAGITRRPSTNDPTRPPLWMEPQGIPGPGDKDGFEDDPGTVLSAFYSGGIAGARWERQCTIDLFYRLKGSKAMLRAPDLDERIRDRLLGDDEYRVAFALAPGTPQELLVMEARIWSEFAPLERSEQAYTYKTSYWFQLYRVQP
jgi:hypothetical protein